MPFFGDFTESSDPAGAPVADPLQYIKDCLPAETAACPLHVKGAWTALFKFFIGHRNHSERSQSGRTCS